MTMSLKAEFEKLKKFCDMSFKLHDCETMFFNIYALKLDMEYSQLFVAS